MLGIRITRKLEWTVGPAVMVLILLLVFMPYLSVEMACVLWGAIAVFLTWYCVCHLSWTARSRRSYVKRVARLAGGVCPSCGYDLTGNVSGECPECGGKLAAPAFRVPPAALASRRAGCGATVRIDPVLEAGKVGFISKPGSLTGKRSWWDFRPACPSTVQTLACLEDGSEAPDYQDVARSKAVGYRKTLQGIASARSGSSKSADR